MKNIVIIDDDPSFIDIVKASFNLSKEKYNIYSALDVEIGFKLALEVTADLYILDIQLPESSGFDISNALDELHSKNTPVIFVSADKKNEQIVKSTKFKKEVTFVEKPIDPFEFHQLVSHTLQEYENDLKKKKFGLSKKPLPIVLIGLFHMIEPLIKIFYLKINTGFEYQKVLEIILSWDNTVHVFNFWFLFPLAGLLILSMRKISYFIFMALQVYMISLHLQYESFTWPYVSEDPLIFSSILIVLNIGFIGYLAVPKIRRPFMDSSVKWWQTPPRVNISLPCIVANQSGKYKGNTRNLSRAGIFFETNEEFQINEKVKIYFEFKHFNFKWNATVIHSTPFKGKKGYGLKFGRIQFGDYYQQMRFMRALKNLKIYMIFLLLSESFIL